MASAPGSARLADAVSELHFASGPAPRPLGGPSAERAVVKYTVTHATTYSYDDDVTDSLGVAHLVPRELPSQRVLDTEVAVLPTPVDLAHDTDFYGNTATYFQVTEPHRRLADRGSQRGRGRPRRRTTRRRWPSPWERARPLIEPSIPGAWLATDFALPSTQVEQTAEARDYAVESLTPGRPLGEAVTDLMHRIHADFRYDSTATTVTSTIDEIFDERAGVCQDFAHLTLACLRSHGLAARYVSGYLATTPPPGRDRVVGADASHAWVAVWVLGLGGVAGARSDQRPVGRRPLRDSGLGPRLRRRAPGQGRHLHRGQEVHPPGLGRCCACRSLELGHLRERAGDADGLGLEVDRHGTCLDSNDSSNAVGVVRHEVVGLELLDRELGFGLEGAAGEVTTPGPRCCAHYQ